MLSGVEFMTRIMGRGNGYYVLVNRSPSLVLDDKTSHEVCPSKKPSLKHNKIFKCDAYLHTPKQIRSKSDNKSNKCNLIGCNDDLKGYKV